jgi:iron(III) transport system permease protein
MAGVDAPTLQRRADQPANGTARPAALRRLVSPRRRRFPWLLGPASVIIVAALLSPLGLIVIQSVQAGWSQIWPALDRAFVATLLWNTVRLAILVTALSAVLGTGAAWLTERTMLPGRRVWSVLLIVPLVVPDFVLSWAWSSIFPWVQGYFGATLVMTLHLYPLVYLPMTAAFRAADPGQEEAARILGLSRWSACR